MGEHKTDYILLNNLGIKYTLIMKLDQLTYSTKKNPLEMWPENEFWALFNFQRILCKRESEEICILI